MMKSKLIYFTLFLFASGHLYAAHTFKDIDTCYHWEEQWQLDAKVSFAKKNNGELYFHEDNVIYCWRTPLGAQSAWEDHGDVLIRIKLKDNKKIIHMQRQGTITKTKSYGDIIYSNDNAWQEYTITPAAVESWSVFHPGMIEELKADFQFHKDGKASDDDVFYAFQHYSLRWLKSMMPTIINYHEKNIGKAEIFGENKENHFVTSFKLPWQEYVSFEHGTLEYKEPHLIKIISSSFGMNVDTSFKDNALSNTTKYCDGKRECDYKVHSKFIGDPAPDQEKSFKVEWMCGDELHEEEIIAPATNIVIKIKCESFKV